MKREEGVLNGVRLVKGEGEFINKEELVSEILTAIQRNAPSDMSNLARVALDSRKVLEEETAGIGKIIEAFDGAVHDGMQKLRSNRMTVVLECASMSGALQDVRRFFLGPNYEQEQKALAEFVDLCEHLKALKDSGFLDSVADTMIRLASPKEV